MSNKYTFRKKKKREARGGEGKKRAQFKGYGAP